MPDSRLPLTIRPVTGGFAIAFADGTHAVYVAGQDGALAGSSLSTEQALDLAKEVARALVAAWSDGRAAA